MCLARWKVKQMRSLYMRDITAFIAELLVTQTLGKYFPPCSRQFAVPLTSQVSCRGPRKVEDPDQCRVAQNMIVHLFLRLCKWLLR
jgi:hypothetical protein